MKEKQKHDELIEQIRKRDEIIAMYERWLYIEQKGRRIENYLMQNGYLIVAIYGVGIIGQHLFAELRESDVQVKYLIDINADHIFLNTNVDVLHPDDKFEDVNAIIITTAGEAGLEVKEMLTKRMNIPILLFNEILSNI